jgi:hypothetical protein
MTTRQLVDAHLMEIETAYRQLRAGAIGSPDDKLIETQRANLENFIGLLRSQDRALAFAAGLEVANEQQFAEAVIDGRGS